MNKLKILYGEHKQALLDNCLSQISDYTDSWPDHRAFLIVPETAKADTERRFFYKTGDKGLMMAEVLSFRRLAYRLFSEAGGLAVDYISPAGRAMLIQSLIRSKKSQFKRFGRFADRPGHAAGIDSVIGDFRRYGIDAVDLERAADTTDDLLLKEKLADFSLLCRSYEQKLDDLDIYDHADDLDRLCKLIQDEPARLEFLKNTAVWIHGFGENRDFTAQEYDVIAALRANVESISVTVFSDMVPGDELLTRNGPAPFMHGRQTAWRLAAQGSAEIIRVESQRSKPFQAIADWFGHETKPQSDHITEAVKLMRSENKNQEIYFVAGEIRRLVVEEGYRYRDIAIAVCDLPAWQFSLQTIFREFGLESFIDDQMPLSGTVLMRYVSNLLKLGQGGNRFEALMSLLRTGLTDAGNFDIDHFENYCLALGLPFRGRYKEERYYSDEFPGREQAVRFKKEIVDPLITFARQLAAPAVTADRAARLQSYIFENSSVGEKTEQLIIEWNDSGEHHAATALVQAWNTLLDLLMEMSDIFDQQKMSAESFASVLSAGMEGSFSRVIPTGLDRVRVSDTAGISQHFARVLFVIGATGNNLPSGFGAEGLLLNRERQQLELISGKAFPDMERYHIPGQANEVYTLLTSPSDRLYLSCPSLQDKPSMYQQRLFALINEELVLKSDDKVDIRWNSAKRATRLCTTLAGTEISMEDKNAYSIQKAIAKAGIKCLQRNNQDEPLAPIATEKSAIAPMLVLEQYPDQLLTSVSRIQKFRECPYSHYAAYLLGLKERETAAQDYRTSGSILHGLIESAFSDLSERMQAAGSDIAAMRTEYDRWLQGISRDYIDRLYNRFAKKELSIRDAGHTELSGAGRALRHLVYATVRAAASQIGPENYMPAYQEWSFPSQEANGLALNAGGRSLVLRGKIDRVDLHVDGKRCRIIDYKSGQTKFDHLSIYHGLDLQLPIYLQAFMSNNNELEPGDLGYFYFQKPVLASNSTLSAPNDIQIQQYSNKQTWSSLSGRPADSLRVLARYAAMKASETAKDIFTGDVSAKPICLSKKQPACSWCVYKSLCNYDDRSINSRVVLLEEINLPDDLPGLADMKPGEKKSGRITFIEELMEEYIKQRQVETDQGE